MHYTASDKQKKERNEKVAKLCSKYDLSANDVKIIDTIATYVSDAIELDKTRNVPKANDRFENKLNIDSLKTDTAKSLIKASYCMQDKLSNEHLKEMDKVAYIDYEAEKDIIMKEFFTKVFIMKEDKIFSENIIESPIVQEEYFKYKYSEIANPVKIGRELGKEQSEIQTKTRITTEMPIYTEQQIGKATINVKTEEKDKAKEKMERQIKTKENLIK